MNDLRHIFIKARHTQTDAILMQGTEQRKQQINDKIDIAFGKDSTIADPYDTNFSLTAKNSPHPHNVFDGS